MMHDLSLNSFSWKKIDQPYDVSPELMLYVITIWFSVLMLPASLSDHRTILICSMRLYLLRMVINAVVLTL
jgi:hypothetical protein